MIKILYFASLRESLGTGSESLDLPEGINRIDALKEILSGRGDQWLRAFTGGANLLVSVNQQMADDLTHIKEGDEIAFFPPVTGG